MMQGHPYESEKYLKERSGTLRQAVVRARMPASRLGYTRSLRARLGATKQMRVWWVPVAFALGMLAVLILRGI